MPADRPARSTHHGPFGSNDEEPGNDGSSAAAQPSTGGSSRPPGVASRRTPATTTSGTRPARRRSPPPGYRSPLGRRPLRPAPRCRRPVAELGGARDRGRPPGPATALPRTVSAASPVAAGKLICREVRGDATRECLDHVLIPGESTSVASWPSTPGITTATVRTRNPRSASPAPSSIPPPGSSAARFLAA